MRGSPASAGEPGGDPRVPDSFEDLLRAHRREPVACLVWRRLRISFPLTSHGGERRGQQAISHEIVARQPRYAPRGAFL